MKEVFELDTPVGSYTISYGHFMPDDKLGTKYHCWRNGCGIGGVSTTLEKAKKHLITVLKSDAERALNEHNEEIYEINKLLRSLK